MKLYFGVSLALIALLFAASCSPRQLANATQNSGHDIVTISAVNPNEVRFGNGIACHTYQPPHPLSAISYNAQDIGKPGVPTLTTDQLAMLRRIQQYVHSNTIRFILDTSHPNPLVHGFAIFDATDGPCADFAPGYQVLNSYSLLYYEPGESIKWPFHTIPENVGPSPGPWFSP